MESSLLVSDSACAAMCLPLGQNDYIPFPVLPVKCVGSRYRKLYSISIHGGVKYCNVMRLALFFLGSHE